jgi:hypothetical protein
MRFSTDASTRDRKRAVVVPVLVAFDEMFQVEIIGKGIANVENSRDRVAYAPDPILPDERVTSWVVTTVNQMASGLVSRTASGVR